MKKAAFISFCPFEIGDKVNMVLDKDKNIFDNEIYIVDDILAIHSLKTKEVKFKLKVKDKGNMISAAIDVNDFKIVK